MFYVSDGKVYVREGDHFRNVGFTAKDKVITRRGTGKYLCGDGYGGC